MRAAWSRRTVFDDRRPGSGDGHDRTRLDGDPLRGDGAVEDGRHGYALSTVLHHVVSGDEVRYCFWCKWKRGGSYPFDLCPDCVIFRSGAACLLNGE